ncbi:LysR family transcriptional regulator [Rhodococcus sp. IEGM 1379]|uniref:LysR family transcriptional regulator n=1 Tax=Rhodococcus sp. IEGM 1379 TaxID=3047086 RepID=UPI0024B83F47|nr:LysR family transcriptional regulator [Rhodococcus sp. IEGM 1379]MDI9913981.1 LysR family transcriptional regulator [Rhodococcus sp. IEGM 1379]
MRMLDPVLLRSFIAVERTGSFTTAAKHLGIRQPTVSGHIAKLEARVGRELLIRDTHRVELTTDGAAMLAFAREILDAQSRAMQYFGGEELSGQVRFGVSEDLVTDELPKILFKFRRDHPGVNMELTIGLSEEIHNQLRSGKIDLAFVKRKHGDKHGQLVFEDRLVWAGAPGAVVPTGQPVPIVTYHPPSLTRDAALSALRNAGIEFRIACTTKGQLALRAATLAGLGFIVHSEQLLPHDLAQVQGLPSPGSIEFVLVTTSGRSQSAPERALTRAIVENTHSFQRRITRQ